MRKTKINYTDLPRKAYYGISKRQRSYIDEFTFYKLPNGNIEAWYGGERIAIYYQNSIPPFQDGWRGVGPARDKVKKRRKYRKY